MAIHNTLPNTELHEPKNMGNATGGASDIGKVGVSKGDGTSEVRKLSRLELSDTVEHYGQVNASNNTTILAVTAAVDATLATNTDYSKVTGIYDAIPHGENNGVTQGIDNLTVTQAGVYEVAVWANTSASVNSTTIGFKFALNGVIGLVRRPKNFMRNLGEFHNMSAHGYVTLAASDVIDLQISSDVTANITIEDMVFSLKLIRAT